MRSTPYHAAVNDTLEHEYRGARAMILLHESHLRRFLEVWRSAKERRLVLTATDDPDYASMESLLVHVLACARGYMQWICAKLELPDPDIEACPAAVTIEAAADDYVEHVLERWRQPLREIAEDRFGETFDSAWGQPYCLDAMLEHAVMHPIRHTFQLEELLEG